MLSNPVYIETTFDAMAQKHGSALAHIQAEFDVPDSELEQIRSALLD